MTYYDHATWMAHELGQWGNKRPLRNIDLELEIAKERSRAQRRSRSVSLFHFFRVGSLRQNSPSTE